MLECWRRSSDQEENIVDGQIYLEKAKGNLKVAPLALKRTGAKVARRSFAKAKNFVETIETDLRGKP
jgi:hypothetical protein